MAAEGSSAERTEAGESKADESLGKDGSTFADLKKAEEEPSTLPNSSRDGQLHPAVAAVRVGGAATLASDVFQQGVPQMVAVDGFRSPWGYYPPAVNSSGDGSSVNGLRPDSTNLAPPTLPFFYPAAIPGFFQVPLQDQNQQQGGVYVVPVLPYFGPVAGYPPGGLVPLSLNAPMGPPTSPETAGATGPAGAEVEPGRSGVAANREVVAGQEGLRHRHVVAPRLGQGPRPEVPRQVVRRFRVGFQLDLFLILKLAVVVVVFNHDGSKGRLLLLLLLASIVYLYQTGALTPFLRWISQSAQRAMMPPPQHPGLVHPEAQAGPGLQANEGEGGGLPNPPGIPPLAGNNSDPAPPGQELAAAAHPDGDGGGQAEEERQAHGPNWWGFLKEVQMIVVGFVTSLLPGYQHVE